MKRPLTPVRKRGRSGVPLVGELAAHSKAGRQDSFDALFRNSPLQEGKSGTRVFNHVVPLGHGVQRLTWLRFTREVVNSLLATSLQCDLLAVEKVGLSL